MRKYLPILITILMFYSVTSAATYTRLYYGALDAQPVAGLDSRIDLGPFFVGADVRALFLKNVVNQDNSMAGSMPDRTDYKTSFGIMLWDVELEYAHTCYHRIISSTDISLYTNNQNPGNTDYFAMRWRF